jgi:succinate-semialdehyde dehydrogenase/glutarate-semialdehyde dehydrogenase
MLSRVSRYLKEAILINGEWVQADSGETIDVVNPANGQRIGGVPKAGAAETRRAIDAAHAAFPEWAATTAAHRSGLMRKLHDALMDYRDSLAELLTLEQGKPLAEAKGEIASSAGYVLWFAEVARRVYGDTIPSPWAERRMMVIKQPVGVIGSITPWNFPSSMLARKIGPALATGCTSVVKPATATPYSGLAWGALAEEVGIPKGVINVLTGSSSAIGKELCTNEKVKKITFTGSTEVGRVLLQQCASTVKKTSMELGGNAPFLVFDDADLERAVDGAIAAKFRNTGQTCVCTNRFIVQSGIYEAFVERLAEKAKAMKVGDGLEDGTVQGPLIDEDQLEKVEEFVEDAKGKGGRIVTGGKRHALGGTFYEPTVIADAKKDMRFTQEEIFGPVAPVYRYDTEEEMIAAANDTIFGLACYFYTQDLGRTYRVMEGLDYGLVGVNEGVITAVEAPFGGYKQSGLGREGGHQGIEEYLESKYVCIGGLGL